MVTIGKGLGFEPHPKEEVFLIAGPTVDIASPAALNREGSSVLAGPLDHGGHRPTPPMGMVVSVARVLFAHGRRLTPLVRLPAGRWEHDMR